MTTTRFAPSPTGYIHVGNLRTALMNYLIARKGGGTFILRIDDTDPERCREEFVDAIKQDMEWLGLRWDRLERQSERLDRYAEVADDLRRMGRFYEAFETPTELDLKRKKLLNMGKPPVYDRAALALTDAQKAGFRAKRGDGVWRFMLDHSRVGWKDAILGDISIDAGAVSDPVLIRADGQVLYTLASVVDDTDMGVTDVVRGSDHVTNTATQIQIMGAIGCKHPRFAHHSLLVGPQGEALSKRIGTLAIRDLRAQGVQPMALLSLIARLGSSDPVKLRTEMGELIQGFDPGRFGAAPTRFDVNDVFPLTAHYLRGLAYDRVASFVAAIGVPAPLREPFWLMVRGNIATLAELEGWWILCRDGAEPLVADEDRAFVEAAMAFLPELPFTGTTWADWAAAVKDATGRTGKELFMPLRKAITGRETGPEMAALMPLMQAVRR